jgi:hypothetical protein
VTGWTEEEKERNKERKKERKKEKRWALGVNGARFADDFVHTITGLRIIRDMFKQRVYVIAAILHTDP